MNSPAAGVEAGNGPDWPRLKTAEQGFALLHSESRTCQRKSYPTLSSPLSWPPASYLHTSERQRSCNTSTGEGGGDYAGFILTGNLSSDSMVECPGNVPPDVCPDFLYGYRTFQLRRFLQLEPLHMFAATRDLSASVFRLRVTVPQISSGLTKYAYGRPIMPKYVYQYTPSLISA